jgi:glutathione S-transferase
MVLREKGIPYTAIAVDLDNRPMELYTVHPPDGRVPVLLVAGHVIVESQAIMEYLEERFPARRLLPLSAEERAQCRAWVIKSEELSDAMYDLYWNRPSGSWSRVESELQRLDECLCRNRFLVGDGFSLADIAYVVVVLRLRRRLQVDLDPYPAVSEWLGRVSRRPAVKEETVLVERLPSKPSNSTSGQQSASAASPR